MIDTRGNHTWNIANYDMYIWTSLLRIWTIKKSFPKKPENQQYDLDLKNQAWTLKDLQITFI